MMKIPINHMTTFTLLFLLPYWNNMLKGTNTASLSFPLTHIHTPSTAFVFTEQLLLHWIKHSLQLNTKLSLVLAFPPTLLIPQKELAFA